jgi:hypothetical protein
MAQTFTNAFLTKVFNQLSIGGTPTSSTTTYYVGLFTGTSATDTPGATATLASISEVSGSGYQRQQVTFATPSATNAYDSNSPTLVTSLSATASSGSTTVALQSVSGLAVGMLIIVGSEPVNTIVDIAGNNVTLSSALFNNQQSGASVEAGAPVPGVQSVGSPVTFSATGSWSYAGGYFVTDAPSGTSGMIYYFSNFSEATLPSLQNTDTLQVSPTWILSN